MAKNISGDQSGTPGYQSAELYFDDPTSAVVSDSFHTEHDIGKIAYMIAKLKSIVSDLTNLVIPFLPTADQKDAMDGSNTPNTGNPFATLADVVGGSASLIIVYTFRTATDAPADTEIKMNNADPTLATVLNISNFNNDNVNLSNLLLNLGENDAILISSASNSDKIYDFDVSGTATQIGGTGTGGYVAIPVTFFSQGSVALVDSDTTAATLLFDGNNTRFLQKTNNLSDVTTPSAALSNIGGVALAGSTSTGNQTIDGTSPAWIVNDDGAADIGAFVFFSDGSANLIRPRITHTCKRPVLMLTLQ